MTHRASALISAQEWFSAGERVGYDAERPGINPRSPLRAFIRRAAGTGVTRTFLPGWPDGSYGWAKVEAFLSSRFHFPRIYLDYIGHGDSDKPRDYPYSTFERADLVEALWHAEGIAQTVVVAFDYSCIVSLELLARRIDRERAGNDQRTRITACLLSPTAASLPTATPTPGIRRRCSHRRSARRSRRSASAHGACSPHSCAPSSRADTH